MIRDWPRRQTTDTTSTVEARDERALWDAARAGDRDAFEAIFFRHAPQILAFARRMGASVADAEDIAQETFVAALVGPSRFLGRARLSTWLLGIALRRVRDRLRQRARRKESALPEDDTRSAPGSTEASALENVALQTALLTLDPALRETFLLVAGQQLTCSEAARLLGVAEGTVKWRVATAARRLRERLADEFEGEKTQ